MKDTVARAAEGPRVGDAGQLALSSDFSYPPIERTGASFEPAAMQRFLDGEHRAVRELVKEDITQPEFRDFESPGHHAFRKQVLASSKRLAESDIVREFLPTYAGRQDEAANCH